MVLSTRISIEWVPNDAEELTSTMVFSTEKGTFTDVRVFKDKYPYLKKPGQPEPVEQVFQFALLGWEEDIAGTNRMAFHTDVNLAEIVKSIRTGRPLDECKAAPDVGAFWAIENSEDRKETGSMENPATGRVTEYVEVWRSLNPEESSPTTEVREGHWKSGNSDQKVRECVYDTVTHGYIGRIVRLGNWVQGVLYDASEPKFPLSVMRRFYSENSKRWITLIDYGKHEFPNFYQQWESGGAAGGIEWKQV